MPVWLLSTWHLARGSLADPCKSLHKKATVSKPPAAGIAGIAHTRITGARSEYVGKSQSCMDAQVVWGGDSYPKSLQIPADPCKSLHKKATVSKPPAAGIAGIAGTEAPGRRRGKIVAMGCTYRAQEAEKQLQGPHLGEQRSPKNDRKLARSRGQLRTGCRHCPEPSDAPGRPL